MEPGSWVFVQMPPDGTSPPDRACCSTRRRTARLTVTSRSRPRSSCFREKPPTSTASFSAARTRHVSDARLLGIRAAPGWTGGGPAPARRPVDAARGMAATRGHRAGKAGGEPVKNVLKVDVDPANVTLWVNAAKVLAVPRADVRDRRPGWLPGRQGHEPAHHDAERDAEARAGSGEKGIARPRRRSKRTKPLIAENAENAEPKWFSLRARRPRR